MNQIIVEAIRQKRVLTLIYDGLRRELEPHCYGLDRNGKEMLRAWQFGGHSKSPLPDWRLLKVASATAIAISETHFQGARPDYTVPDKAIRAPFAQL